MIKNVLYITYAKTLEVVSGGATVTSRNSMFLRSLINQNIICYNIENRNLQSNGSKLINDLFNLSIGGLSKLNLISIGRIIELNDIETVFLDSSNLGVVSKYLATNYGKVKIIVFSHNVEYKLELDLFILSFRFRHLIKSILCFYSERLIFKYSFKVFCTTNHDLETYRKKFKKLRKEDCVLPVSVPAVSLNSDRAQNGESDFCLFVGSNYAPNIHGILWFIKEILPNINYRLLIVGKGISCLSSRIPKNLMSRIEILDYVPNLDQLYKESRFVVAPIFYGSGMKVKVAEAIQYGKPIFLSSHAFCGYESLNKDYPIFVCNSSADFIKKINQEEFLYSHFEISTYNLFSHNSVFQTFKNLLIENDIK